jgi:hypothetical protein
MIDISIHQIKKTKIVLMKGQKKKDSVIQVYIVKKIVNILIMNSQEEVQLLVEEIYL